MLSVMHQSISAVANSLGQQPSIWQFGVREDHHVEREKYFELSVLGRLAHPV